MAHSAADSAIRVDSALEKQIMSASPEEMKAILHQAAIDQGLCYRDAINPTVLIPTELANAAPKRFAKTVAVDGQKRIFEGDSELEVERAIGEYYRDVFAAQQTNPDQQQQQPSQMDQPRDASGRFVSAEDAADVERFLTAQGISLDNMRQVSAQCESQQWSNAVQEFLNSPSGADWQGGHANLETAGRLLHENGLPPTAESINQVWQHMKQHSLVAENPQVTLYNRIANARSPEEMRDLLGINMREQQRPGVWR